VISLDQALAHGMSRQAVRRLVATGRWRRLAHRVYQDTTHELTRRARVRAVLLSLGDHAVLVGEGAAWWWGLRDQAPARIEVAVGHGCHQRSRPDAVLVLRTVPDREATVRHGIRVTTLAAAVRDGAASLGADEGARLMDRALQQGLVALDTLRHLQLRRSGRHGAPVTARLLALAAGGAVSEAERLAHTVLRMAAVLGWTANLRIDVPGYGRAVVDLAFPAQKVIVEIDGWAYHRDLRAFRGRPPSRRRAGSSSAPTGTSSPGLRRSSSTPCARSSHRDHDFGGKVIAQRALCRPEVDHGQGARLRSSGTPGTCAAGRSPRRPRAGRPPGPGRRRGWRR
jgi:hypothetical protein